ncbi:MAG: hypothetical protein ACM3SM_03725 [Bacteroidota bacterium]
MEKHSVLKVLRETIKEDYILSEDYQDKYYLSRQILEKLPDYAEEDIYRAIDLANAAVKHPRRNEKFLEALAENF